MDANANAQGAAAGNNEAEANRNEGGRGDRPNRNNGDRGDRGNRTERIDRRLARNLGPGSAGTTNPDGLESAPMPDDALPIGNDQAESNAQNDGAPREKRSRDRYGRDRKPRSERTDAVQQTTVAPADEQPQDNAAPRKSYFEQAAQPADALAQPADFADTTPGTFAGTKAEPALATMPDAAEPTPAVAAPVPVMAMAPSKRTEAAAQVHAPRAAAPTTVPIIGMPQVGTYLLPTDELAGIAQQSGLTWVNSDAEKIAAVQAVIAAELKPTHVPRERPPVVTLDDRPLVLVETKLDLRDIKLPFEEMHSA
jgi:ribonuclease E